MNESQKKRLTPEKTRKLLTAVIIFLCAAVLVLGVCVVILAHWNSTLEERIVKLEKNPAVSREYVDSKLKEQDDHFTRSLDEVVHDVGEAFEQMRASK